jgi:hypothetical protein
LSYRSKVNTDVDDTPCIDCLLVSISALASGKNTKRLASVGYRTTLTGRMSISVSAAVVTIFNTLVLLYRSTMRWHSHR